MWSALCSYQFLKIDSETWLEDTIINGGLMMQQHNTELLVDMVRQQFKKHMHETDPDKIQKLKDEWVCLALFVTLFACFVQGFQIFRDSCFMTHIRARSILSYFGPCHPVYTWASYAHLQVMTTHTCTHAHMLLCLIGKLICQSVCWDMCIKICKLHVFLGHNTWKAVY